MQSNAGVALKLMNDDILYIKLKKHVWKYVWKHVRKYGRRNIRSKNFLQFSYIFSPSNTDIY